jgi:uncharacterized membrane protein
LALCWSSSAGLRQLDNTQADLVLAFTLYPVVTSAGQLAVLAVAVAVLIGFLLSTKRATSASFFWGVHAGTGFVLSFDIVWVHWIFGLHHLTNTQMDLVLEPLFVLLGLAFLVVWDHARAPSHSKWRRLSEQKERRLAWGRSGCPADATRDDHARQPRRRQ